MKSKLCIISILSSQIIFLPIFLDACCTFLFDASQSQTLCTQSQTVNLKSHSLFDSKLSSLPAFSVKISAQILALILLSSEFSWNIFFLWFLVQHSLPSALITFRLVPLSHHHGWLIACRLQVGQPSGLVLRCLSYLFSLHWCSLSDLQLEMPSKCRSLQTYISSPKYFFELIALFGYLVNVSDFTCPQLSFWPFLYNSMPSTVFSIINPFF